LGYISGGRAYITGALGDKIYETFTQINTNN
jgi:hypothetical protein